MNSAGAILLAGATALILINLTSPIDYVQPRDPIFLAPLNDLFWIIGAVGAITALVCFFSEGWILRASLPLWLALDYIVLRAGLLWNGCHSLAG